MPTRRVINCDFICWQNSINLWMSHTVAINLPMWRTSALIYIIVNKVRQTLADNSRNFAVTKHHPCSKSTQFCTHGCTWLRICNKAAPHCSLLVDTCVLRSCCQHELSFCSCLLGFNRSHCWSWWPIFHTGSSWRPIKNTILYGVHHCDELVYLDAEKWLYFQRSTAHSSFMCATF